ncbi:TonB-dependent receptor [Pseudomonas sp. MS19]|uniref:TonB-dependent receptor family protein n=1 Tax=Pseudomonas sp. MS19 TaxID=2579939 RepID=UPI001F5BB875|nr:TonB-dependent receptor [Pseudomonas sp. MS19]
MRLSLATAAGVLLGTNAQLAPANEPESKQAVEMAPLLIVSPRIRSSWLTTPAAVSVVESNDASAEKSLTLQGLLASVPGVFSQNQYNLAQGLRPSIRGFGARGNFGVRGVRVLVDGVPLTMPDGQTELDGLDLGLVERLEVLRGPSSVLYGNAAGGVLNIETRQPPATPYSFFDLSAGELGYQRARVETGGSVGDIGGLLSFNSTQSDGYRDHARAETNSLTGKLRWYSDYGRLRIGFNAIDNRAEDPGGLQASEVDADRGQAAPNNLRYDADETIRQQRLSAVWDGFATGSDEYQLRSYVGQREFGNRLPFTGGGQTTFDRLFAGIGGQYSHNNQWLGMAHKITAGFDVETQRDDRRRYDNLLGERGAETLKEDENADSSGIFVEDQIDLAQNWQATLGVRYDRVRLSVDDRFLSDGDDSGSRNLEDWNYSAGLSYQLDAHQSIYAKIGTSFETPTISELANPAGGGFNPSLQPSHALNRELGLKGEWQTLRYDLAVYSMKLDDELVAYSLPGQSGRNFYRNAGESHREGVEMSLSWQLADAWRLSGAYTYSRFRFDEYQLDGADYSDNSLAGIPQQTLFTEIAFEQNDYYARLNLRAFDSMYANDANTVEVAGYALTNLRAGKRFKAGGQLWEPYVGVDNLFDREYYDNVRINDANGRYFEPGPGRTVYAGLRVTF